MDRFPGIKLFRSEGCLSYLYFDRASGQAAVIDPHAASMSDYREYLADQRLKIVYAIDTHIHADHPSATHLFARDLGARIAMSAKTQSERPTLRLTHGQKLSLGDFELQVLETPGHTPDSISLLGRGLVFTGDTLLIGSTGRTDFPGADAAAQYRSLHDVLGKLPDDTLVFPAHDYSDLLFSTIGTEKSRSFHFRMATETEFSEFKRAEQVSEPGPEVRARLDYNRASAPKESEGAVASRFTACGAAIAEINRTASISVEKYAHKIDKAGKGATELFLDVREPQEYRQGHMPGTRNIPVSELGLHLAEIARASKVYVSCLSGGRSGMAAKTLAYVGIDSVVNVTGGFRAWTQVGLPVEESPTA